LSYLQSFPFDKLKIDRSFIQNLLTRSGAKAIVRAITELADALGIETTAEGVEDSEQLEELRAHGCATVQGFLFARPLSVAQVADLLRSEGYEARYVAYVSARIWLLIAEMLVTLVSAMATRISASTSLR